MPSGVVVVTGSGGAVGRRLVSRLGQDPTVTAVVAVDRNALAWRNRLVDPRRLQLGQPGAEAALREALEGADVLVHLAFDADTERQTARTQRINLATTRQVLDAATEAGVRHVVALSSATVYGAWANNPGPLTEDAPLRPNPDFAYAVQRAEVEQLLADWAAAAPGRTVAVLRPCVTLGESGTGWLARALTALATRRLGEEDSAWQFLHLDDLAQALDVARRRRLDGAYNVAPDGWIPAATVRALAGVPPRPRQPVWAARLGSKVAWFLRRGRIPPGLLPYAQHRWVVANDRLRNEGWAPTRSNEQAFVAGIPGPWWTLLTPKRRQELALGGMALGAGTVAATTAGLARLWVRRLRRR